jgi:hypothetical protein
MDVVHAMQAALQLSPSALTSICFRVTSVDRVGPALCMRTQSELIGLGWCLPHGITRQIPNSNRPPVLQRAAVLLHLSCDGSALYGTPRQGTAARAHLSPAARNGHTLGQAETKQHPRAQRQETRLLLNATSQIRRPANPPTPRHADP